MEKAIRAAKAAWAEETEEEAEQKEQTVTEAVARMNWRLSRCMTAGRWLDAQLDCLFAPTLLFVAASFPNDLSSSSSSDSSGSLPKHCACQLFVVIAEPDAVSALATRSLTA